MFPTKTREVHEKKLQGKRPAGAKKRPIGEKREGDVCADLAFFERGGKNGVKDLEGGSKTGLGKKKGLGPTGPGGPGCFQKKEHSIGECPKRKIKEPKKGKASQREFAQTQEERMVP